VAASTEMCLRDPRRPSAASRRYGTSPSAKVPAERRSPRDDRIAGGRRSSRRSPQRALSFAPGPVVRVKALNVGRPRLDARTGLRRRPLLGRLASELGPYRLCSRRRAVGRPALRWRIHALPGYMAGTGPAKIGARPMGGGHPAGPQPAPLRLGVAIKQATEPTLQIENRIASLRMSGSSGSL